MRRNAGGIILIGALALGALSVVQKANLPAAERKPYIEVHGPNVAFVPMTEKFVRFDGKIKRIVKFTETLEAGREDCKCPKCCDGNCYVIIFTDVILPGGPIRSLYFLWIEC
jgi:hypothetical protein